MHAIEPPAELAENTLDQTVASPADIPQVETPPSASNEADRRSDADQSADTPEDAEEDPFEKLRRSLMAEREDKSAASSLPKAAVLVTAQAAHEPRIGASLTRRR